MQKKSLLILMLVLFVKLAAIAGPRSFVQAQKIAENQASRLGIVIDNKARAKARAINGADSHLKQVVDYYVFPNGADKVSPSCRAMTVCPKSWAMPTAEPTTKTR